MWIVCVTAGLLVGSLFTWAADYVPRFSSGKIKSISWPRLAVWRLLTSFVSRADLSQLGPFGLNVAGELVTGCLFVLLWERFGFSWQLLHVTVACLFFLLIALIDLKYRLVMNVLVYPAAALVILMHALSPGGDILATLLGGVFGLAPFLAAAWLKPEGMGGGDVKLATLIGLMAGFPGVMVALLIAVAASGIAVLALLLTRRGKLKSHIPYAPFLCLGAMVFLIYPVFLFFPAGAV